MLQFANLSSDGIQVNGNDRVSIPGVNFKIDYRIVAIDGTDVYMVKYMEERWTYLNKKLFGGLMKMPIFSINRRLRTLGLWRKYTREIEMGKQMFKLQDEQDALGTLVHEMAHQYNDEVLHSRELNPHGPSWQHIMVSVGMSPNAKYEGPPIRTTDQIRRSAELKKVLDTNQKVVDKETQETQKFTRYTVLRYANPNKGKDHPIVVRPYRGYSYFHGWTIKKDGTRDADVSTYNPDFVVVPGPLKAKTPLYKAAQAIADQFNASSNPPM